MYMHTHTRTHTHTHRFCCHTLSLAASAATKLLHLVSSHSPTLLTSSPFPSMSFATLLALRSRDTASAAKGPKVYDLIRPPAGGLAFRPRSPLGELTCALPNSLRRLSVRTFFRPFTRTHHHLGVRVLAAPLYCLLPLHTSASLHTSAQSTLVALCLVLLEVSLPFSAAGGSICPLVCLTIQG